MARLAGEIIRPAPVQQSEAALYPSSRQKQKGQQQVPKQEVGEIPAADQLSHVPATVEANMIPKLSHFTPRVEYPFLVLLASGGHTSIMVCHDLGVYTVLGGTLDDALGEAFDKAARLLGLDCKGASGGAAIEKEARNFHEQQQQQLQQQVVNAENATAPHTSASHAQQQQEPQRQQEEQKQYSGMAVPMRDKPNCDFSYAGLKNSFRLAVQRAREQHGLSQGDVQGTNAPLSQMAEAPEPVVRNKGIVFYSLFPRNVWFFVQLAKTLPWVLYCSLSTCIYHVGYFLVATIDSHYFCFCFISVLAFASDI